MMKNKRLAAGGMAVLIALAVSAAHADEQGAAASDAPAPSEQEIADSLKKLVFVPHDTGAPAVTDAGGVRAVSVLPKVELLAPDRMARTLSATPTLYWHISKATSGPVRFTLLEDDATVIDPLLELDLGPVDQEGIYGVSLDDHGLTLESGKRYIWSIALSAGNDSYSSDLVAQTVMEHDAAPDLAKALENAPPDSRALRLAAEGFWYDTVDVISDQIASSSTKTWQTARANLLTQAGLLQAARFDRK